MYEDFGNLFCGLYNVEFEGCWGTLGDFLCPSEDVDTDYVVDNQAWIRLAAALSEGRRSCIGVTSLYKLLMLGFAADDCMTEIEDVIDEITDKKPISVYTGINRAIFRGGVALTSEAYQTSLAVGDPFDWEYKKVLDVMTAVTLGLAFLSAIAAFGLVVRNEIRVSKTNYFELRDKIELIEQSRAADATVSIGIQKKSCLILEMRGCCTRI